MKFQGAFIVNSYADLCSITNKMEHTATTDFAGIKKLATILTDI
jgi:hypothetical protein